MSTKKFEISYNPYINRIHLRQALVKKGTDELEWAEIESDSSFQKFQGRRCIFENCVEEILDLINKFINTTGELVIEFIGTVEDFEVLLFAVERSVNPKSKGISCEIKERYLSSSDALVKIRNAYNQIKNEFDDYLDNDTLDEDDERTVIGKAIIKFQDTVRAEIPVCVIGNYSVGKSALVNALVGLEILPSHANSTTAKNVLLENGRNFCLKFKYKNENYMIEIIGSKIDARCSGELDEKLIKELTEGTENLKTEEQILHQIIENLNTETSEKSKIAEIESSVRVTVPFRLSELDTDKYSFVLIDTPGSNNGDEAQKIHRKNLEELMDEQTNALPIFVMGRNSLETNDVNDLRTLLENKEAGFAVQNCIIAISMSDQLVEQQLSEEMPDKVKQWLRHPTIMYVSPVAAIGEKKKDKKAWIDQAYRQIYEKKMGDLAEVNPPKYNETPCGRQMSTTRINAITPLLYASGVPSLETEINYFAYRFAEYKKCTNGREYLLTALDIADKKLLEAKKQLEEDKKEKLKEQVTVRAKIRSKINAVPLPAVNTVINTVNGVFTKALNDYCSGVDSLVRVTWEQYINKENAMESFEKAMANHCQKNLYDAHIKEIKENIEAKFIELTSEYMSSVKKCVTDEYYMISEEAQDELDQFFSDSESGPQMQDVSIGVFERIKLLILGHLPFNWAQEMFIDQYSKRFCEKLQGSEKKYGVFALQCIIQPAKQYCQQITEWSNGYKTSIDTTLNKDNAILSELDEKINAMEEKIEDMEKRLKNLAHVKTMLQHVLPEYKEGQANG